MWVTGTKPLKINGILQGKKERKMAMEKFKVTESNADGARSMEVEFDFGDTLDASAERFSDEVVHKLFVSQAKVQAQSRLRDLMKAGKSDDEIRTFLANEWVPGARAQKAAATPLEKLLKIFGKLSDEEKAKVASAFNK